MDKNNQKKLEVFYKDFSTREQDEDEDEDEDEVIDYSTFYGDAGDYCSYNTEYKEEEDKNYENYLSKLLDSQIPIKEIVKIIKSYNFSVPEAFVNMMEQKILKHQAKPSVFDLVSTFLLDPDLIKKDVLTSFYDTLETRTFPLSWLKQNNYEVLFLIKKHLKKIKIVKKYSDVVFVLSLNNFSHCCGQIRSENGFKLSNCFEFSPLPDGRRFTYDDCIDFDIEEIANSLKEQKKNKPFKIVQFCLSILIRASEEYFPEETFWTI